ncbi:hypothetical protein M422DRAFT_262787 [Sphaerobolus stellatus SS14]|uniref:Uncharacterized protein n=1 Tax=Sphaerobolus stellatus (strain SS14) TaxID=990650 RepID=A0A0C9TX77_SPHS4|nr:hypothetical protein M422DRAFT_262787 [Sphaerobolus stellatus SS14]
MPTTQSQATKSCNNNEEIRQKSPSWACEDSALPNDVSSPESSCSTSHERSIAPELEEDNEEGKESRQHQPFLATCRDAQQAWINLAQEMEKDSRLKGTGHKQNETRSLQKMGTKEDIDEHVQVITDLMALIDGHDVAKEQKSAGAKAKASKEQQAALELHDAAVMGMRPRNMLSDITQLDGATACEKQGQCKCKQSQMSSGADKENCAPPASKCVHNQTTIASVKSNAAKTFAKNVSKAHEKAQNLIPTVTACESDNDREYFLRDSIQQKLIQLEEEGIIPEWDEAKVKVTLRKKLWMRKWKWKFTMMQCF